MDVNITYASVPHHADAVAVQGEGSLAVRNFDVSCFGDEVG